MTTTATASAATTLPMEGRIRPFIGTALTRVIVPIWLLVGALFKLITLDPRLLPKPVFDFLKWTSGAIGTDFGPFLMFSFRSMVAVELILVGIMFFVPKFARAAAIAILSLFCMILVVEVIYIFQGSDFAKKGFAAFLEPCGCFGSASPPTIVTLAIDATLLIGCILCAPGRACLSIPRWPITGVAAVASMVVGLGLGFGKPERVVENPHANEPVVVDGTSGNAEKPIAPPTDGGNAEKPTIAPWPPPPEKLKASYFINESKVLGQRIDTLDIALLIGRPLPGNLNEGRWHLVYYRRDCDHCHDILKRFFSKELPAPTLAVEMPDTDGAALPMPCKACTLVSLPKGPDYVIMPPLVMTVENGIVVGITTDVDKKGAVEAVLNAGRPDSKPVDGALVLSSGAPAAATATPTPPTKPAVSTQPFPPAPAQLESFYAPEFEKWPGQRFDADPFALLVKRPLPFDLNAGKVIVVYYRSDCEHCHTLLADHFSSTLPAPTIAIAIPDTDPSNALDMPCAECKLSTLPEGPTYVIETPVLIVIEDGVVKGTISGAQSEDPVAVEKLLGISKAK